MDRSTVYVFVLVALLSLVLVSNLEAKKLRSIHYDYSGITYNSTVLLNGMLSTYDRTKQPDKSGADHVNVKISMDILGIHSVSEEKMEITVELKLTQSWFDERLIYSQRYDLNVLELSEEAVKRIWTPNSYFVNAKSSVIHGVSSSYTNTKVYPHGEVHITERISAKVMCPMDFTHFPLDENFCPLYLESYTSNKDIKYTWKDIEYSEDSAVSDLNIKAIKVMAADVQEHKIRLSHKPSFVPSVSGVLDVRDHSSNSGQMQNKGVHHRATCMILLARKPGRYVMQVYIPLMILVLVGLSVFWYPKTNIMIRLCIGISALLADVVLTSLTNNRIPYGTNSVTAMDVYFLVCMIFLVASVMSSVFIYYRFRRTFDSQHCEEEDKCVEDNDEETSNGRRCVAITNYLGASLLCVFVLFNAIYFVCYGVLSNKLRYLE